MAKVSIQYHHGQWRNPSLSDQRRCHLFLAHQWQSRYRGAACRLRGAKAYYEVNCSGQQTQVSATRSGPPLAIPSGTYSIGCQPPQWNRAVATSAVYMPAADNYPLISAAALIMASKADANAVTPAMIAAAQGFVAPIKPPPV
jgi:hypothetical protein